MRYFIFTILTISMIFNSNAQFKMKRNGLGLHAGVNTTTLWNIEDNLVEISPDHDPMPGYQVGIRYNIKFGPLGFCPEINYTSITTGDETASTTLNYVSVPLLVKLYMGGFNIHFGGQASTLLGGTYDEQSESYDLQNEMFYSTVNGTEYWALQGIDLAAILGVGIDTKMGVYASCRTVMSLVPVENILLYNAVNNVMGLPDYTAEQINALYKAVSVQMSIGYKF